MVSGHVHTAVMLLEVLNSNPDRKINYFPQSQKAADVKYT
jgi:hypothetical protein